MPPPFIGTVLQTLGDGGGRHRGCTRCARHDKQLGAIRTDGKNVVVLTQVIGGEIEEPRCRNVRLGVAGAAISMDAR